MWSFDGSSTGRPMAAVPTACLPVAIFPDPGRLNSFLVMTEVNVDGTPVYQTGELRSTMMMMIFGLALSKSTLGHRHYPSTGFPPGGYPGPQGPYYCSVGLLTPDATVRGAFRLVSCSRYQRRGYQRRGWRGVGFRCC